MSRTIRRKKGKPFWYANKDEALMIRACSWRNEGYAYCDTEEEYYLELKKFHSDFGWGGRSDGGVPTWFVNLFCTKRDRQRERAFCTKAKQLYNYEDAYYTGKFVKDAGWMWW